MYCTTQCSPYYYGVLLYAMPTHSFIFNYEFWPLPSLSDTPDWLSCSSSLLSHSRRISHAACAAWRALLHCPDGTTTCHRCWTSKYQLRAHLSLLTQPLKCKRKMRFPFEYFGYLKYEIWPTHKMSATKSIQQHMPIVAVSPPHHATRELNYNCISAYKSFHKNHRYDIRPERNIGSQCRSARLCTLYILLYIGL